MWLEKKNGDITAPPINWGGWSAVVQQTIQHYSGRSSYNLNNVAYEVWNEPDLFGNWKIGGEKDYRLLYKYAIEGANQAKTTNPFKIGGPAITAPYKAWVDGFLDYIKANNLRIDFYSWHRYSLEPEEFLKDINKVDIWLFQNAGYSLEKYLTEWGSVSENSPYHDSNFDAVHLVATLRQLIHRVDLAFVFEIKDGPSPEGKKYWGRWGLLTHEKAGLVEKKPRYFALQLLNKITGTRILLEGEGTWVTGFASKEGNKIKIILVNFDQNNRHFETVPLTINNLANGTYSFQESFLIGAGRNLTETITNGFLKKEIPLSANNIVVVELTKI
jgi:beta-xylosidase